MLTKNLQILRKKHYLSLEKFGNIFGVSKQLVHNWEKGVRKPDIFMLKKIANHFGLEVDQLLEGELTIREPQLDYTPNELLLFRFYSVLAIISILSNTLGNTFHNRQVKINSLI